MNLPKVSEYVHGKACDRDMCEPDCPYRKACQASDHWYPGKGRRAR